MLRHSAATVTRDTSQPAAAGYAAHSGARLTRVVPLHDLAEESDVTLISLELWTTCMALRLAPRNVDSDPITRLASHSKWRAVDDTGGEYVEFSYYSSEAAGLLVETRMFGPALNASARTLTISAPNATGPLGLAIPLP
ncbi:hypothetical protein [Polymorphospora sp. NPDC050346]|uniref:hypothetical protein n=1 Tax=Polymorphospora sp. NPDC050346 TaxID=3155780 RepID=UPI0033CD54A0